MEDASETKLSVINSVPETSDVETPVEQQADNAVTNPMVSLFSRQRRQKVFPTFPPDSDPYDEDQAELNYLRSKPTCFLILGKPGVGKTTLAKRLAETWKCQLVNASQVINEALKKKTENGLKAKAMLTSGEAVPDEMIINMMEDKVKSAEVAHQGYVMDDFPVASESNMSVSEQVQMIKKWSMKPDFIINIKLPDTDLSTRRSLQKVDPLTGEIFTKEVYDPELPVPKKKESEVGDGEEDVTEEEEEEQEEEEEEDSRTGSKLSPDVINRLLWRPEDRPLNLQESIRLYNANVLSPVEDLMAQHDQQHLIVLDGNKAADVLFDELLGMLKNFPIRPAVLPLHLIEQPEVEEEEEQGEEGGEEQEEEERAEVAEVEDLETEELMRTMSTKFAPSSRYKWRRSRWLRSCPVELADGNIVPGKTQYTVSFLDKIYVLSSAKAFESFMKNPRPYLLPPQPRPPCKLVIYGPPKSGKTQLSYRLADKYDAKVIDMEQYIQPKIMEERNRRREEFREQATRKAIEEVRAKLIEKNESEQRIASAKKQSEIQASEGQEEEQDDEEKEKEEEEEAVTADKSAQSPAPSNADQHEPDDVKTKDDDEGEEKEEENEEDEELEGDGDEKVQKSSSDVKQESTADLSADLPEEDQERSVETVAAAVPSEPSVAEVAQSASEDVVASVPVYVDEHTPEVIELVEAAMRTADFDEFQLPEDVWLDTMEQAIVEAERSRLDNDSAKPLNGGWILENFPKTKDQWTKLLERNKLVPDSVLYLQDESPNGDLLTERWYAINKAEIDQKIQLRKADERLNKRKKPKEGGDEEAEEEGQDDQELEETQDDAKKSSTEVTEPKGSSNDESGGGLAEEDLQENEEKDDFPDLSDSSLPEDGPELKAQREVRKKFDEEWVEIANTLAAHESLEPLVIDVTSRSPEADAVFVARSRNEIFDDAVKNLTKSFTYQAMEKTDEDDLEEEEEEEEEEVEEEETQFEGEEEEDVDPNRSPAKQLGDTNFYCPVALAEKGVLWPGDPEISAMYREKMYYLSNIEAQEKFLANPSSYVPKSKPNEPPSVRLLMVGPRGAGKTLHGREMAKKLGLFHIQFRERLQELVIGKMNKRVRPEREEEQEADEQELPPEKEEESSDDENELEVDESSSDQERSAKSASKTDSKADESDEEGDKEPQLTEDEEAIVSYLKDDEPLPTELLQKLLEEWWHQEPFKSSGFVLEGLPRFPNEATLLAENGLYPDAVISLELEDSDVIARLLPPRLTAWQKRRKELLERKRRKKERHQKRREEKITKRRNQLLKEAEQRKLERAASKSKENKDENDDEDDEEDVEDEMELEEDEDIDAIIADEFPPEEEEEEEELETEQDAIERMKSEITEAYENEAGQISAVTERLDELMIPVMTVEAGKKAHIVRYLLTKKMRSIVQYRHSMFERVYAIKPRLAEKLLATGHKQMSRFGRWCPVKLLDGAWMMPNHGAGVPTYPAVYRQHVYFLSSIEARKQFTENPIAYLCQPTPKPAVQIRIAIIGPPKSGKTTLARRFVEEFGLVRLSIGEALRWVLENQPKTELAHCLKYYLSGGFTVPDEFAVQALEVCLMGMQCRTRGYVLDGFPVKKIQIDYMEQRNIIPVQVIELQLDSIECADRATADRYSKDRVLPLHDSAEIFLVKWGAWQKEVGDVRKWYSDEHDNLISIPGNKSKWWVWNECVSKVQSSVVQIQTYLQRISEAKAASVAGMCITPSEFSRRLGEFAEYCPVNLANDQLVDCSHYKHHTYAAEYKGLYYKMEGPEQLEAFLAQPDKYVPPQAPRQLPPKALLPKLRSSAEAKQLFPMPIDLRGYCPVTFLDGKCRYEAIVPGDPELVVEYNESLYYFETYEKLQKFMRTPHLYSKLRLPNKLPPKRDPLVVSSLPMLGYMEQTVATAITKALTAVGVVKPKYPFVSATKSALLYVAFHLKAFNPSNSEYVRKKYKKKLEQFEEMSELIQYLGKNMSKHYKDPKDRPIDFDFKLHKFVELQREDKSSWVS